MESVKVEKKTPSQNKNAIPVDESLLNKENFETEFVHDVYEDIAGHFSDTRHKPWPKVADFVAQFPCGSLIADIGCGNGKYLPCASPGVYMMGCDRSLNLCSISKQRGNDVWTSDCISTPLRDNILDGVISIAVIHHLSTEAKRVSAMEDFIRLLRPGGKALIYVWALEQNDGTVGARSFEHQDVFVPWCASSKQAKSSKATTAEQGAIGDDMKRYLRYYHISKGDEVKKMAEQVRGAVVEDVYYDSNNWAIILKKL
eukprot:GDKJ01010116.1.p1 GENE.GDKJ01010116.1~~GDKJ01010116.1.p1  ORF type:complete len:257 (-),score=34.47 GDKJ01010116.1:49-819(-)